MQRLLPRSPDSVEATLRRRFAGWREGRLLHYDAAMQAAVTHAPKKLVLHPAWLVFAALALAVPMSVLLLRPALRKEPPVLAELPQFSLVDEDGKAVHRDDLLGKVWIADFVFTSCADACPRMQAKMKSLQERLTPASQGGSVGLLSVSVDPERDTPERLRQYAKAFGQRKGEWRYLTGDQREVERTVVKGFHIAMAKLPSGTAGADGREGASDPHLEAFDIMHGQQFVLVDRMGRIRGFYDADDADAILRDARALTAGGRG
ncbi:MAG TPA: SCO family protein [Myxococcales bacterium]|jgi:protein SCO1/2